MRGLRSSEGFVGNSRRWEGKKGSKKMFLTVAVISILLFGSLVVFLGSSLSTANNAGYVPLKNSEKMLGNGGSTPYICYGNGTFVTLWFGKDSSGNWMLNATEMDVYGNILKTTTITSDIALYNSKPSGMGPRMAYDPYYKIFFMIWYSSNKSLDGLVLNDTLVPQGSPVVLNSTVSVNYHGFGLTYIGESKFLVSWSDNKYDNYYRIVEYVNDSLVLGNIEKVSSDAQHSHLNNMVAYDPLTGNIMVIWRNSTGKSGVYNITGKIFNGSMKIVKNDFTIANGYKEGMSYDMPNIAAGDGRFMVIYGNRSSPYDVYGVIINASNGEIMKTFLIGQSYVGLKYYGMGIAYNGSGGFMVAWPNSNKNIEATLYSCNGTKVADMLVTNTTHSEEAPMVAAGFIPTRASNVVYQFVWYDYTSSTVNTANYSESALVPEFTALVPVLAVLIVAIAVRKRH